MRAGLLTGGLLLSAVLFWPELATGRKPEDVFRGKIVITEKRPPQRGYVSFLQKNRKEHVWPDKKNKDEWRYEFMAFFPKPLNDLEVTVKFYDVTEGRKFVAADTFYLPERGQRIFASSMVLSKPRFNVNRKYTMEVQSARRVPLASTLFWLRGEKERYSGKVTFTDEETRAGAGEGGGEDD